MASEVTRRTTIRWINALGLFARWGLLAGCLAGLPSCKEKPKPKTDPPASSVVAVPSESAARRPSGPPILNLAAEVFAPDGKHPTAVHAIEGALMVVEANRVGRINGDSIEWIGSVPKQGEFGDNIIASVEGRWPDTIGAVTHTSSGRAPVPTFFPLTWKSHGYVFGSGGSYANIVGLARTNDSFFLMASTWDRGYEMINIHGPKLKRKFLATFEVGCKPLNPEMVKSNPGRFQPGVNPWRVGSTPAGTMVTLGDLCSETPAAEVWDKEGPSRVVDLKALWKKGDWAKGMLKGAGDELFIVKYGDSPILHYREGKFDLLPELGSLMWHVFASPAGKLHAANGRNIYRFDEGRWTPVARLAPVQGDGGVSKPPAFAAIVTDGETFWASDWKSVYRLRPVLAADAGSEAEPVAASDPAASRLCPTPFVYISSVSSETQKKNPFPKTRKALSTFPEVSSTTFVEFEDNGSSHIGVKVTGTLQGEALIAHLKANLKDESPKLTCYDPLSPKTIALDQGGK